jgi:hypothetical protein
MLCHAGIPKSMHMHVKREVPNANRLMPAVNVEQIAAEVEKLLGQKSGLSGASMNNTFIPQGSIQQPTSQNAITAFLNAVVQLHNAVPGINIMQLLQAVGAPQEQTQALPNSQQLAINQNPMANNANTPMDLKGALSQAQLQLGMNNQMQSVQVILMQPFLCIVLIT